MLSATQRHAEATGTGIRASHLEQGRPKRLARSVNVVLQIIGQRLARGLLVLREAVLHRLDQRIAPAQNAISTTSRPTRGCTGAVWH